MPLVAMNLQKILLLNFSLNEILIQNAKYRVNYVGQMCQNLSLSR